jgi:hypothetical protein
MPARLRTVIDQDTKTPGAKPRVILADRDPSIATAMGAAPVVQAPPQRLT